MLEHCYRWLSGWHERRRTARAIARLDPHLRADIGCGDDPAPVPGDPAIVFRVAPTRRRQ